MTLRSPAPPPMCCRPASARPEWNAGTIGPGDMLLVCTDGMSNPMRNENVRAQLAEWRGSGRVPSMREFGWQMSYRVKTYDDDRTAVCVWGR
jgi:serine/threonine protein phosphatase PrpC